MRTIRFKGKRPENGEWVYGSFYEDGDVAYMFGHCLDENLVKNVAFSVDRETVCQFTGFLDKNGNEIYEGDVLRSDIYPFSCVGDDEYDNYYGTIGWSEYEASFYIVAIKNPKSSVRGLSDGICDSISQKTMQDFEVVGSIHDKEWQEKLNLK